jgi:hypothetical protein
MKAKDIKAEMNNCPFNTGFREIPVIKFPKSTPNPAPGPIKEIVAKPAPKNLLAVIIFTELYAFTLFYS